jgi:RNA polymerase sigma-70 factor (ECF subfamily)
MSEDVLSNSPAVVKVLVENHRRFLRFLEKRVGSSAIAEEILQAAFVKGVEKAATIREGESSVAWFYRLLRNAVADHYRQRGAEERALERHSTEAVLAEPVDTALEGVICSCVGDVVGTLKPEYEEMLRRVDLLGSTVQGAAQDLGITANNAGVRLHRARLALRKQLERVCGTCTEHGCLDCTCRRSEKLG